MLFFFLITDHFPDYFPDYFPDLGTDHFPDYLAGFGGRRLGSCGTQGVAALRGLRRSGSCDFASQSSSLRSSANLTPSAQAHLATEQERTRMGPIAPRPSLLRRGATQPPTAVTCVNQASQGVPSLRDGTM